MFAGQPDRVPSPNARPPLRLVRPGERRGAPEPRFAADLPGIRFTRRGRLVITLMATVTVVALAVMLAASVDAAAPEIDHATTVSAGQTLSEVAATQLPGLPIPDAVARIQLANGLNSLQVQAGQLLLIPVSP